MDTYILMAPDYAQIDDWDCDVRYFHAGDTANARLRAAAVWSCDPEDIVVLLVFTGELQAVAIQKAEPGGE